MSMCASNRKGSLMNRRDAIKTVGAAGLTLAASSIAAVSGNAEPLSRSGAQAVDPSTPPPPGAHPKHDMRGYGIPAGQQQIAMLVYPNMTALELIGPQMLFSKMGNGEVLLVGKTHDPVTTDTDIAIQPTNTFADCPDNLTVLFVPGGAQGAADAMDDAPTLQFLAHKAKTAKYVTSVGTGSLLLGAAGLLRGYKATSHWMARDFLAGLGAHPVKARVVADRNRITGAGATAALDLGLYLVARLRSEKMARALQLALEYDPHPPFHGGTPETTPPAVTQMEWAMNVPLRDEIRDAVKRSYERAKR